MMQQKIRVLRFRCALLGVLTSMAACVSLPPPILPTTAAPSQQNAADLARRGEHARAASAYEALVANSSGAEQSNLQLAAAREWLAAQRVNDAERVLMSMTTPLNGVQAFERGLLAAEISLALNRAPLAWQQINLISASAEPAQAFNYYTLRMRIALAAGQPVDGVRAEIAAEASTANVALRLQLRTQLLAALMQARARGVPLGAPAAVDPIVRGWLELAATATQGRSVSLNGAALAARWRAKYPDHPALAVLSQAFPAALASAGPGTRIALLLPLSGPAAPQGATVRDGFLSALYQLPAAGRPQLRLYDTAAMPATQALAQARAAGSNFIVGPLIRDAVSAVAALGAQPNPVLALNFLTTDQPAPAGLFQFALSPEEEARITAQRILADGHHHGIVLAPRDDWGMRVASAFERELTLGGGSTIAVVNYDPAGHDYGDELKSVLRIDDSQARLERLERALRTKLNFEPRHRADIEFVFIVAETAVNARLIEPQLRYSYASDIPSYSISNAYEPDAFDANRDIAGLMYPDMPWMIAGESGVADLRSSISEVWGNRAAWQSRLFAFGYDACQLILAMSAPYADAQHVQIDGLTGQLHFDPERRVQRELIWVRVNRDGEPRPLGPSQSAAQPGPATPAQD